MEQKSFAQLGYEAYAEQQGWQNYAGNPIPPWQDVRSDIQDAWGVAAHTILAHVLEDVEVYLTAYVTGFEPPGGIERARQIKRKLTDILGGYQRRGSV